MSDRRAPRKFEPPPWEADQFAELQRRQAEEDPPAEQPPAEPEQPPAEPEQPTIAEALAQTMREKAATEESTSEAPTEGEIEGPGASTSAVAEAMLAQLAAEEPPVDKRMWKWGTAAAAVLAAVGLVLMVWGGAFFTSGKSSRLGSVGGGFIATVGVVFLGAGLWVVFSNLRKRGVI